MNVPVQVAAGGPKFMEFNFAGTLAICRHADESIVASIASPTGVELVTFALMVRQADGSLVPANGMFVALPAEDARGVAVGLLEAADRIDGGKGKQ